MADPEQLFRLWALSQSENRAEAAAATHQLNELVENFNFADMTQARLEQYHQDPRALVFFYEICIFTLKQRHEDDDVDSLMETCRQLCDPTYIDQLWGGNWGDLDALVKKVDVKFLCVFAVERFPEHWDFLDPETGIGGANIEAVVAFLKRFCKQISSPNPDISFESTAYEDIHRALREENGYEFIMDKARDGLRQLVLGTPDILASLTRMGFLGAREGILEWLDDEVIVGHFREAWGIPGYHPACLHVVSEVVPALLRERGAESALAFLSEYQVLESMNSWVGSVSTDSIGLVKKAAKTLNSIGIVLCNTEACQVIANLALRFLMCPHDEVSMLVLGFLTVLGLRAIGGEQVDLVTNIADRLFERLVYQFGHNPEMALNPFCEEVCHVFSVLLGRVPEFFKPYLDRRARSGSNITEKAVVLHLMVELYYEGVEFDDRDWKKHLCDEYRPIFEQPVTPATWTIFVNFQKLLLRASNPAAQNPITHVIEWQPLFTRCLTEFQNQSHPHIREQLFALLKKFPELKPGKIKLTQAEIAGLYDNGSTVPLASALVDAMPLTKTEFIRTIIGNTQQNVRGCLTFFASLHQPVATELNGELVDLFRNIYERSRDTDLLGLLISSLRCVVCPEAFDLLQDILNETETSRGDFENAMVAGALVVFFKYSKEHRTVCQGRALELPAWVDGYSVEMVDALESYTEVRFRRKDVAKSHLAKYYCFFALVLDQWMDPETRKRLYAITIDVMKEASMNLEIWGVLLSFIKRVLAFETSNLANFVRQVFTLFILTPRLDYTSKEFGNVTDLMVEILLSSRATGDPSNTIVRDVLTRLGVPRAPIDEFISVVFSGANTLAVKSQVLVALYNIRRSMGCLSQRPA